MGKSFVHLHTHTEYSLLDGASRLENLIIKAKELEMPALAITDHGVMYGIVDFYKLAKKHGVKPIIGCEVYVAPRSLEQKEARMDESAYHLVLLAENQEGYHNLLELVSTGFTKGFYYKPRIDKELLRKHSKGLIGLSACLAGEVATAVLMEQADKARVLAQEYLEIFGKGNFYLELQDHGLQEQYKVNRELIKISKELNIPLIATNDIHYVNREDAEIQDVLLCIQTGKTVDDEQRMKFSTDEFFLKSREEMELLFGEYPEALDNSLIIAERCNLDFSFDEIHLPYYEVPPEHDLDSYLRERCYLGAESRFGELTTEITERLEFELEVIKKMGYSGYFLIVWDFIHYARQQGILVGPGRGSAAGSLVAFVLGITNIDPLKYDLLFERFLNPERVSMPDIDIDFCFERRGEVINYVVERYGEDKVSQIITFGTMAARAAIRDVGRALNLPYGDVDKVAKLIPHELGITIKKALEVSQDFRQIYEADYQIKKLIDTAAALEGMPRHASTHAAGVVISKEALTHYLPLYRTSDGVITTQFAKERVEELGLLKMDLLGLRTLTVIDNALKQIKVSKGIDINIDEIPLDDVPTFELLSRGEGIGVFQLESSGMRAILKDLKPGCLEDIIALVALYRPGPLGSGMVDDFIRGKHGEGALKVLHPKLEPILKDTYGVILYQEQVMRIASDLAGFTLGEADLLRRAMGKKKPEVIAGLRNQFIEGATKNNISTEISGQVFDLMEYFAGYGFNKSHSAAYAVVSYQTAYLKANYPLEFMAALLTSIMGTSDKVAMYIEECRKMGIEVLPPDVNESLIDFTVVNDKIRFGLAAVKNVGRGAIESIIEARVKDGSYKSLLDFCERVDLRTVNKRVIESLIKCGAFDTVGGFRAQLMAGVDKALEIAQSTQKERENGQISFFDVFQDNEQLKGIKEFKLPAVREYSQKELLALEKEMLGLYITGHPLSEHADIIREKTTYNSQELKEAEDNSIVILAGLVAGTKGITTRRGENMMFINFEDLSGMVEVVVFPKVLQKYASLLRPDSVVFVKGRLNHQEEEVKILAEEIYPIDVAANLEAATEKESQLSSSVLYVKLKHQNQGDVLQQLKGILKRYKGNTPVLLFFEDNRNLVKTERQWWINLNSDVVQEIQAFLGEGSTALKEA